MFSLHVK